MPDIFDKIKSRIKQEEGFCLDTYLDTRGFLTVGYGHKITDSDNLKLGDTITKEQAENFFNHDFCWVLSGVKQLVKGFDKMPDNVKLVLCSMAFNNGIYGLKKFKRFLGAIDSGNWKRAADEIVDSANYRSKDLHNRYVGFENLVREAV